MLTTRRRINFVDNNSVLGALDAQFSRNSLIGDPPRNVVDIIDDFRMVDALVQELGVRIGRRK